MENFSKLKVGEYFEVNGEKYRKTGELTFDNLAGIEQYIDPLWDKKINAQAKASAEIDTSAKMVPTATLPDPDPSAK